MAFHWQTFRTRALSAILFVALMAVGLLWTKWSFLILFSIVHFGCWVEYQRLVKAFYPNYAITSKGYQASLMISGWGVLLALAGKGSSIWGIGVDAAGAVLMAAWLLLLLQEFLLNKKAGPKTYLFSLWGILYISASLGLLAKLRTDDYAMPHLAMVLPLLLIFTNWINDTMAYIVGSLIGKTPFSPISPKKTWEGTIGGVVLSVVTISIIAYFTGLLPVHHAAALSALGAISGTYGDLFESKLKRMAGVKDSGQLMPGHGGFLDRFDSLLFSATVGALYIAIAMQ